MNDLIGRIKSIFLEEVEEIWNRYQQGKKPHFFPYDRNATDLDDMLGLSLGQMISVTNHLKTYNSWKEYKNILTFDQWIVYKLLTSSLKGTKENILQRVQSL